MMRKVAKTNSFIKLSNSIEISKNFFASFFFTYTPI